MKRLKTAARAIGTGLFFAILCNAGVAQQVYCMRNGQVDAQTSQQLQQMLQQPNPQVMQVMTGTWYSQTQNPGTGQMLYSYVTYEPNGLWGYRNRVCSNLGCNDYEGTGVFAGVPLGNGQINLIIMYSDLQADHTCIAPVVRPIAGGMLQDSNGQTWQRVR